MTTAPATATPSLSLSLCPAATRHAVRYVSAATSNENHRYALRDIAIVGLGGVLHFAATDGKRLHYAALRDSDSATISAAPGTEYILPAAATAALKSIRAKGPAVSLIVSDGRVLIGQAPRGKSKATDYSGALVTPNCKFPPVADVIPRRDDTVEIPGIGPAIAWAAERAARLTISAAGDSIYFGVVVAVRDGYVPAGVNGKLISSAPSNFLHVPNPTAHAGWSVTLNTGYLADAMVDPKHTVLAVDKFPSDACKRPVSLSDGFRHAVVMPIAL